MAETPRSTRRKPKREETEIAQKAVAELQRQGFETYEEVRTGYAMRRADIVGVRGSIVAVVECKASLSLALLNQLLQWRGEANLIIGAHGFSRGGYAAEQLCRHEGFGLWSVGFDEIHPKVSARLFRHCHERIRKALRPEHRSGASLAAGSQGGGYWTPFRATCRELTEIVGENPGIALREALKRFKHHYANEKSAVAAIPDVIKRGLLPGMRAEGRPLRLYLDSQSSTPILEVSR